MLVQGVEPSFRWRAFAIELMELAQAADVSMVITLGALMADVAHSRPIPVSATSDSEDTRHRHDLEMSSYEGPTGIVGVLADAATQVGVPSVSCWAAVPHYAGHSPSPKATLALVRRMEDLLDAPIEHGDLDGAWRSLDPRLRDKVWTSLEAARWWTGVECELLLASGRPAEVLPLTGMLRTRHWHARNPTAMSWHSPEARALHALGRTDEAMPLAEEALALARSWGAPSAVSVPMPA